MQHNSPPLSDQQVPHSMCMSLRLDPATLRTVEQEQKGKTLSATMNAQICGALLALISNANEEECDK